MVLKKPSIRLVGEENKKAVVQKFEERYKEEDLVLDYLYKNDDSDDEPPFDVEEEASTDDSMDWLAAL